MQSCAVRSCGVRGGGRLREIGRRTDDRHAHVRPDADRDHVLRHFPAGSHARIVAFGDDVGQAVVDDDLDLDVGIIRQKLRQCRPEDRVGRILGRR